MSFHQRFPRKLSLAAFFSYSAVAAASPTAGSPYFTDPQHSHVEDATSKGIGQVNSITCYMSAMRPDALVNQGNYIALVDQNKCDSDSESSASNAGSSSDGSQAPSYQSAIVNSTRTSDSVPMRAKIWVDQNDHGQQGTIFVNLSAAEAPTDADPYGQFRLDFCGVMSGGPAGCAMRGFLEATSGGLQFYQDEQSDHPQTVALQLSSVGTTSGSGGLTMVENDNGVTQTTQYLFAYDTRHFLRGDQCFSRDASDPATGMSVWRYGLYDATSGERIDLNSGFPIQYSSGSQTYQGYIGYWGLSLPSDAMNTLTTGSVVQKVDYGNNDSATLTNYSVVLAGGKLTKYTRKTSTLHDIDQITLNTWVNDATNLYPGAQSNTQYQMYWDETSALFVVTAQIVCGSNGCDTHSLDVNQSVSPAFWSTQGGVQGWSQSLGGDVFIDLRSAGDGFSSALVPVVYHAQDLVYPSDMPATLYCVSNCPTAPALQSYFSGGAVDSPYAAGTFNNWNASANAVTYSADIQAGVLTSDGGLAAAMTDANAYQQYPQYQNGVRSGRLFTSLADAECSPGSGTYCDYKANDLDVYYTWETGPNNWNRFADVKDGNGNFLRFDAPLQVTYNVPSSVTFGAYAGKSIVLQYGGFGNLWGIPGNCVSNLTNQPESCDTPDARYVPQFVIPYDTTQGVVSSGSAGYLVKWLDREIRFAKKDPSECAALTLPGSVTLPTAADVKNPTDPASDIYIGDKPAVTDAPRVIQGDVKY